MACLNMDDPNILLTCEEAMLQDYLRRLRENLPCSWLSESFMQNSTDRKIKQAIKASVQTHTLEIETRV